MDENLKPEQTDDTEGANIETKEKDSKVRKIKEDSKVVIEYRKPSILMSILLILIGMLIATIIFLALILLKLS